MDQILDWLLDVLISLPAVLIALSVHELFHGLCAHWLGDPTAKLAGRLSLNPADHLDPIGFLMLLFFRVGWAKPVPVNVRYLKNPKRDLALISLAGPMSNFVIAFLSTFLYLFLFRVGITFSLGSNSVFSVVFLMVQYLVLINLGLGVFNLIPVPPLDGSNILFAFLPYHVVYKIQQYQRWISLALFLCLWLGVLSTPINFLIRLIFDFFLWLAKGVIFLW